VVKPLTMLTSPKVEWMWSSAWQKALDKVKQRLRSVPIVEMKRFIVIIENT